MTIDPKSPVFWSRLGYVVSAAWMIGILVLTGGDTRHPMFEYIFIVPLVGWVLGLLIGGAIKRARGRSGRV